MDQSHWPIQTVMVQDMLMREALLDVHLCCEVGVPLPGGEGGGGGGGGEGDDIRPCQGGGGGGGGCSLM